ncbi:MAG TPA: hypothetical protein VGD01_12175 [Candidatus Elarobacter sp.]|jgi:hypothetical protein
MRELVSVVQNVHTVRVVQRDGPLRRIDDDDKRRAAGKIHGGLVGEIPRAVPRRSNFDRNVGRERRRFQIVPCVARSLDHYHGVTVERNT